MCGITGVYSFEEKAEQLSAYTIEANKQLTRRGPDNSGTYNDQFVSLGHTRLSIIDTSPAGNQPFSTSDGNYQIVFNGEFYNYQSHRNNLIKEGHHFQSESDTEVLLELYRKHGTNMLGHINGCFALSIWDKLNRQLFIARDRMGIKPLYYYQNRELLCFASEMKALLEYPVPRELDTASLYSYFQLNYLPDHQSMIKNVKKLNPGHYILISDKKTICKPYYQIPQPHTKNINKTISYTDAQKSIKSLLRESVERRMIADVPLGAFLSGGLDSSIIVALASQKTKHLNTFSIGFKDQAYFDETRYAETLASKYQTNHTSFSLSNDELFADLFNVLEYIDEPFADSSALAVHILSQHTRKHVTVALSGDGADEMFGGYNKHMAHTKALESNIRNSAIKNSALLWRTLPKSRNGKISNTIRQLYRFSEGLNLSPEERYWRWCSLSDENSISDLLKTKIDYNNYTTRKNNLLQSIKSNPKNMSFVLYSDMHMVLCQDMLMKVDLMSMGNSLEVRTPFLDHNLVDYAFSLPIEYKIHKGIKKRILRDAFKYEIPESLLKRPKHGFEVPLLDWFRKDLSGYLDKEIFNTDFLSTQNIFNPTTVLQMKKTLNSKNPGDIHARIWAMIVFQAWWKKTIANA